MRMRATRASVRIVGAGLGGGAGDRAGNAAGSVAAESPGAERAVDFSHVMVQQDVGGARRANAEESADDARGGHRRFQRVGFEPAIEEIHGARSAELRQQEFVARLDPLPAPHQPNELLEIAQGKARGIGRRRGQHRPHEPADAHHRAAEILVRLGVQGGKARDLPPRAHRVVRPPQIVAFERRERAVERENFEAVAHQVQLANDFRAEQGDYVGKNGEAETGNNLFGNSRAAEHGPAFNDKHLAPGASQVRGVHQAIVPAPDDDDIVGLCQGGLILPGSRPKAKRGILSAGWAQEWERRKSLRNRTSKLKVAQAAVIPRAVPRETTPPEGSMRVVGLFLT